MSRARVPGLTAAPTSRGYRQLVRRSDHFGQLSIPILLHVDLPQHLREGVGVRMYSVAPDTQIADFDISPRGAEA
jgi:hypothetical protein